MKHLDVKNFVCPHCGLRKTTNRELKQHLNVHSDEKKFQCKECPQAFNTYGNKVSLNNFEFQIQNNFCLLGSMNNHVRVHHKKVRLHTCSHCRQTFARKRTMKNHEMTHTGACPYYYTQSLFLGKF